jgi:hypothetical protein
MVYFLNCTHYEYDIDDCDDYEYDEYMSFMHLKTNLSVLIMIAL